MAKSSAPKVDKKADKKSKKVEEKAVPAPVAVKVGPSCFLNLHDVVLLDTSQNVAFAPCTMDKLLILAGGEKVQGQEIQEGEEGQDPHSPSFRELRVRVRV